MKTSFLLKCLLPLMAMLLSAGSHAQQNACMAAKAIVVAGQKVEPDQCLQNVSMQAAQFKQACDMISKGIPELGIAAPGVTYMAACPAGSVNVCEGFAQGKLKTHYYKKEDSASLKKGCEMTGGQFK